MNLSTPCSKKMQGTLLSDSTITHLNDTSYKILNICLVLTDIFFSLKIQMQKGDL